jgi:hypothetical protein
VTSREINQRSELISQGVILPIMEQAKIDSSSTEIKMGVKYFSL